MQKYPSFKRCSACSNLPTGKGKIYFPQNTEEFGYHSQSHKCESSEINATNYFHFAPKGEIQLGNNNFAPPYFCLDVSLKPRILECFMNRVSRYIALNGTIGNLLLIKSPRASPSHLTDLMLLSSLIIIVHLVTIPGTLLLAKHQTVMSVSIFPFL